MSNTKLRMSIIPCSAPWLHHQHSNSNSCTAALRIWLITQSAVQNSKCPFGVACEQPHRLYRGKATHTVAVCGLTSSFLKAARRTSGLCKIEHTSQGRWRDAGIGRRNFGADDPGTRCELHVWIRDYAEDRCERCTALLSTVQGTNTLKRFDQYNSNGATHGRCDILLSHVRNVCRPRLRIGHRTLTRLFLADALEYELAEVDRIAGESKRCETTLEGGRQSQMFPRF